MHSLWTESGKQENAFQTERKPPDGVQVDPGWHQNGQVDGEPH